MARLLTLPALLASPTPIDIDRDQARREALQELLKPEYAKESLIDRAMRAVSQFLGDLLDQESVGVVGSVAARVVLAVIVIAAITAVVTIARRATRGGAVRQDGIFGDRRRTAAEHRDAAERLAAESRWAEAVRERLRAVARDLEDRAIVDSTPGRTAGELAAEAGRVLPAFAGELTTAARVFDDVTYGEVPGTAEAYEVLRDLDERLRTARPVPAAPAKAVPS
ncbi:DUF4129 domain-containing protein [Streptosporangium roseum]|uniref:Protein-glutamine gamma-glutamyltransferase-like C-terminal domain-containing protein n=1 Tax=Streptosporangium roseum (strain ATCC 12428 / DSM 43021 / JCM 3005 / KCTC 9067 / NCIMB 10171 / NRRL 2505 / NI 9100) TaxID=479432 RepID=D2BEP1_STRRD|nr:DUF4129 domain-containing protein [Streptosporangium roseum]ACZ84404.1 hypothetical protein Sros_1410 [Streptosporangium roseum DSM 43021]